MFCDKFGWNWLNDFKEDFGKCEKLNVDNG